MRIYSIFMRLLLLLSLSFAGSVQSKPPPAHLSVNGNAAVTYHTLDQRHLAPGSLLTSDQRLVLPFLGTVVTVSQPHKPNAHSDHQFYNASFKAADENLTVLYTQGQSTAIGEVYTDKRHLYFELKDSDLWVVDITASRLLPGLYHHDVANPQAQLFSVPTELLEAGARTLNRQNPIIIDTLLIYTPNIVAAYPGDMTETLMNHVIAKANQTFVNSGANILLRLVDTELVDFTLPSSLVALTEMASALDDSNATVPDASLANLSQLRDSVGADLVAMIRTHDLNEREVCGVARFPTTANDLLINVSNVGISGGSNCVNTFTHEVGHNFGAGHQQVGGSSVGALNFSGALIAFEQYNTIMSSIGTGDDNRNYKLPLFSSPSFNCGGDACGDAQTADNVSTINFFAEQNAALRAQVVPGTISAPPPTDPDSDGDGSTDSVDHFPFFANESDDDDNDGIGNNADAFPNDPSETLDTDDDGIGNNSDNDDDGDGVSDGQDDLPLDARDSIDMDGDSFGVSRDELDNDFQEQFDADQDNIGDIADPDDDNDGVPDFYPSPTLAQTQLLVVSAGSNAILSYDAENGDFESTLYTIEDGGFSFRSALIEAPNNQLFVIGFSDVIQIDRQRDNSKVAVSRTQLSTNFPVHLAANSESRLYVNNGLGNSFVEGFNLLSGGNNLVVTSFSQDVWRDIEVLTPTQALVVSRSTNQIFTFNPQEFNGPQQLVIGTGLNKPEHLAVNAQGDIFVSNAGSGEIRRFASNGVALGIFVAPGSGGLTTPSCMDFGPDGNLYVCSMDNDRVLAYDGDTGAFLRTAVDAGEGGLSKPVGLVFASRFADEFRYDPNHDSDNDGVLNPDDAFPLDPNETLDTDNDGIGNNADEDDDGDGMPDSFEEEYGFDPLDPSDGALDADGDGVTNAQEFINGTDPTVADDPPAPAPTPTPPPADNSGGSSHGLIALLVMMIALRRYKRGAVA